jgi:hypothetical protein
MAIIGLMIGVLMLFIGAVILCVLAVPFFWVFLILVICSFGILSTIFWIWMLVDCIKNESIGGTEKICWTVAIALTHFLGALIYFFAGKMRAKVFPPSARAA